MFAQLQCRPLRSTLHSASSSSNDILRHTDAADPVYGTNSFMPRVSDGSRRCRESLRFTCQLRVLSTTGWQWSAGSFPSRHISNFHIPPTLRASLAGTTEPHASQTGATMEAVKHGMKQYVPGTDEHKVAHTHGGRLGDQTMGTEGGMSGPRRQTGA